MKLRCVSSSPPSEFLCTPIMCPLRENSRSRLRLLLLLVLAKENSNDRRALGEVQH